MGRIAVPVLHADLQASVELVLMDPFGAVGRAIDQEAGSKGNEVGKGVPGLVRLGVVGFDRLLVFGPGLTVGLFPACLATSAPPLCSVGTRVCVRFTFIGLLVSLRYMNAPPQGESPAVKRLKLVDVGN